MTDTNLEQYTHILAQAMQFDYERDIIKMHKDAIADNIAVDYHTQRLKEIQESNTFSNSKVFYVADADDFYRLESKDPNDTHSVIAFIEKETGNVYKPETWDTPNPEIRYNLLNDVSREACIRNADWKGGFLH